MTEVKAKEMKRLMNPALRPSIRRPRIGSMLTDYRVSYQVGWGVSDAFCGDNCAAAWAFKRVKRHRFDPKALTG